MTHARRTEQRIRAWLADEAPANAPDRILDATFARTVGARQRRSWWVLDRWRGEHRAVPRLLLVAALTALLVAALAGSVLVGSRLLAPVPEARVVLPAACCLQLADGAVWAKASLYFERIDPATNTSVRRIRLARVESVAAIGFGSVWATEPFENQMVRYDAMSGTEQARIAVGELPDHVITGLGSVWASGLMGGTVSRIDPATNAVVATIRISPEGRPGPGPMAVAGGRVWVNEPTANRVHVIAPETNSIVATVRLDDSPCGIGSAAELVWVGRCSSPEGGVTALHPTSATVAGHVAGRENAPLTPPVFYGGLVWITSDPVDGSPDGPGRLIGIDPTALVVRHEVEIAEWPTSVGIGFGSLWTTDKGGVSRLSIDRLNPPAN